MQPIENKIRYRIYGRGRGWAFTKTDFIAEFGEANIHKALSSLTRSGKIRRVCRGVYDYPRLSEVLDQPLSPDIDQVAHALARKFNWRIEPSGHAALNILGLSTQVPGRWVYLSNGPSRDYKIGRSALAFKTSALKDIGFRLPESALIVQALKSLGKENVDPRVIKTLRRHLDTSKCEQILKDTRAVTSWVYGVIKQVCKEST